MKTIILKPTEFKLFEQVARLVHLWFTFNVSHGKVYVEADAKLLQELGY